MPLPITLGFDRPAKVSFELPTRALQLWSDNPVKAAAEDNVISILDPIGYDWWSDTGVTAKGVAQALRQAGEQPVTVQINSPGGDFFEGLAIYNLLAQHKAEVTVQVIGIAASAASVIAMAGDRVEISRAAFVMIHNTQWVALGDRNVMRETADTMEKFDLVSADLYAERTGLEPKAVGKMMDTETWMGGTEAVAKGFADQVMTREPAKDGAKQSILYRLEAALQHLPRSERRKLIKELATPGAGLVDTPRAVDTPDLSDPLGLRAFRVA